MAVIPKTNSNRPEVEHKVLKQVLGEKLYKDLGTDGLVLLAKIRSRNEDNKGAKRLEVTINLLKGISFETPKTTKSDLIKLLSDLVEYHGDFEILANFCARLETSNPYEACKRAQVNIAMQSNIPKDRIQELQQTISNENTDSKAKVLGDSGVLLTGKVFWAYDPNNLESAGFFSGAQAIKRIYQTFAKSDPTIEKEDLGLSAKEVDHAIKSELKVNTSSPKEFGVPSHIIDRDLNLFKELEDVIKQYRNQLGNYLFGQLQFQYAKDLLRRPFGSGGMPGNRLAGRQNLPEAIEVILKRLKTEGVKLDPQERSYYLKAIFAYERLHLEVDKQTALSIFADDLAFFNLLPENHPLKKNAPDLDQINVKAREVIASKDASISYADMQEVLSAYPFEKFREAINSWLYDTLKNDLETAKAEFRHLFFDENGKWLEDSLAGKVPINRLRENPLSKYLSLKDYRAIMQFLELDTISTSLSQLFKAASISDFKKIALGTVTAFRKISFSKKYSDANQIKGAQVVCIEEIDLEVEQASWKEGRSFAIFSARDVLERWSSRPKLAENLAAKKSKSLKLSSFKRLLIKQGLFKKSKGYLTDISFAATILKGLIPKERLSKEVDLIKKVRSLSNWINAPKTPEVKRGYFTVDEAKEIVSLAKRLNSPIILSLLERKDELTELATRINELVFTQIVRLDEANPLELSESFVRSFLPDLFQWKSTDKNISYLDPISAKSELDKLSSLIQKGDLIPATELSRDQKLALRNMISIRYALEDPGKVKQNYSLLKAITETNPDQFYIHKEVLTKASDLAKQCQAKDFELVERKLEWIAGELRITFGKFSKNKRLQLSPSVYEVLHSNGGASWMEWCINTFPGKLADVFKFALKHRKLSQAEFEKELKKIFLPKF
ncbi:MAG: hypothetical protein KDD56_02490 [Bdellovibrionales bacterium]|nr:hypothetical protein [Bdellovibrionales bacterium]